MIAASGPMLVHVTPLRIADALGSVRCERCDEQQDASECRVGLAPVAVGPQQPVA